MEHLDVLVVGAGLSGIGAGHYLQTDCPWASYAIFEARDAIGGTWDLFRYPGIRSDSDMYTLGYSFRPWDGEKSIADGASILQYIKDTAAAEGHRRQHPLQHPDHPGRVVHRRRPLARHRRATAATRPRRVELTGGFLFSCSGYYRYDHGYLPDFTGRDRFEGTIVHPQAWPDDLDYAGQARGRDRQRRDRHHARAVDGGAPPDHVTMLQRSPTYIASMPETSPVGEALAAPVLPERGGGNGAASGSTR